jgi:hypothetical protein
MQLIQAKNCCVRLERMSTPPVNSGLDTGLPSFAVNVALFSSLPDKCSTMDIDEILHWKNPTMNESSCTTANVLNQPTGNSNFIIGLQNVRRI